MDAASYSGELSGGAGAARQAVTPERIFDLAFGYWVVGQFESVEHSVPSSWRHISMIGFRLSSFGDGGSRKT
jgi:hypothetical protein